MRLLSIAGMRADMTLLGLLIEWPRRKHALDDGPRIVRKGDRCEREPEVDPLEELCQDRWRRAATLHHADERASHPIPPPDKERSQ